MKIASGRDHARCMTQRIDGRRVKSWLVIMLIEFVALWVVTIALERFTNLRSNAMSWIAAFLAALLTLMVVKELELRNVLEPPTYGARMRNTIVATGAVILIGLITYWTSEAGLSPIRALVAWVVLSAAAVFGVLKLQAGKRRRSIVQRR